MTGPSKHTQETSDRLLVRYRLDDGSWQADWTMPVCWDELDCYRRANLRAKWLRENDAREVVEVKRISPKPPAGGRFA